MMKTFFLSTLIIVLALSSSANAKALRIISLKPNITEILFAIGAGADVVGVTTWCDFPEEVKTLPKVADYIRPNIEAIIGLHPDMVLTSKENSLSDPIRFLETTGVVVKVYDFTTIEQTLNAIEAIGSDTGHASSAQALSHTIRLKIDAIHTHYKAMPLSRTLMLVGRKPMIAASASSFFGEALSILHATALPETATIPYPTIGMEQVIALKPDVIIDLTMGSDSTHSDVIPWKSYTMIPAVQSRHITTMEAGQFRMGPRLPDWLETLGKRVHP